MEIAVIGTRGYPSTYGGFETFVRRFAPFAATQGARVRVYGRGQEAGTTHLGSGSIRTLNTPGLDTTRLSTLSYGLTSSLHAAVRRVDVALVMNVANGFWLPALKARGIPTAVNVDGLEWERAKWSRLGRATFLAGASMTARLADALIADSQGIADYWSRRWDCSPAFIPYGADVPGVAAEVPDVISGLGAGEYLLIVARLVPENNVDFLLDALALTDYAIPTVVVGSSQTENGLTERLRRLDSSLPHFFWLGHVSDQSTLAALWQNAGLYLHGHSVGGTNPALLQALGNGAPTLAFDTVFNAEVLEKPSQLFPLDAPGLARRLEQLMEDEPARHAMREHGRDVVRSRYDWDEVNGAYLDLLTGLVARRAR